MNAESPSGAVMVYNAPCTLGVVATVPGAMMVIVADAETEGSFMLVAVTVAVEFCVTAGAVKFSCASTLPTDAPPVDQVTPDESWVTVAVNCIVCPAPTNAAWGETATVTGPLSEEPQPTRQKRKDTQQTSRGNLPDVIICFFPSEEFGGSWTPQ